MEATIYARQSLDRHRDSLAVDRQLDLCRRLCSERGWEIVTELVDNDRSATSGKDRPEFERLLASRPQRIVVWHVDRLVRLTRDLERVIALGVDVHAVTAGHLDLSSPAGRAVARTVTAWATYEGEQKALRQKASNDQRAAAGKPTAGRRTFGYSRDGMSIVESEAEHTRAAVTSLLAGEPLRTIVRRLNEAGVLTTAGNPWKPTEFRNYLKRPRLAGIRVHRGEVVGPGLWPAIISEEDHAAVCAILNDPARRPRGRPRTYLLSGVARCATCGGRIYGRGEQRGPIYVCESHAHLGRRIGDVDSFVEQVMVARLSLPDAHRVFTSPENADRADTLRAEQVTLTGRLDDLAEAFADGGITARQLTAATSKLRARLDQITLELPSLVSSPALQQLVTASDVAAAWDTLTTETKRVIIGMLADVTIHPAGRGSRVFDPETVQIEWKASR